MTAIEAAISQLSRFNDRIIDLVSNEISSFNQSPPESLKDEDIAATVDRLLEVYALLPLTLGADSFDVWRVRLSSNSELYRNVNDAGPPPKDYAQLGRLNSSGTSVFYCGTSPETCFAEARLSEGDWFHLFRYGLGNKDHLSLASVGDMDSIRRSGQSLFRSPKVDEGYKTLFSRLPPHVVLSMQLVDAFLFDHMNRKGDEQQYRVTRVIAEAVMSGSHSDGVMFPSVEHAGGINFALKSQAYSQKIKLKEASAHHVKRSYGYGAYRCSRFGPATIDQSSSTIVWPDVDDWASILKSLK